MSNIREINRVVEGAKTRRAQSIAPAVEAYAVPAILAAGLTLLLLQFSGKPPVNPVHQGAPVATVTSVER